MKAPPKPNAANIFELYRRRISKVDPRFPLPHFTLSKIDIIQLYVLYPDYFPYDIIELFKPYSEEELKDLHVPDFEIKLQSAVMTHHPKFNRYNSLYKDFELSIDKEDGVDKILLREVYLEKVKALNKEISNDIILQFYECILSVKGADILRPQLDTLFFVCIFFYNMHWDVYETSFNGKVSEHGISPLTLKEQPHLYRAHNQVKYISKLLYDYFKAPNKLGSFDLVVGGKPHLTDDPIIINWVVQSLIDSILLNKLPLSLDYLGGMLFHTLTKRVDRSGTMLLELKALTDLKPPTYRNEKRKVVRSFCLDIHKAFANYLGTSNKEFKNVELSIYHNVLRLFNMDDFSARQRSNQHEDSSNPRKDTAENRLGELLRRRDE